MAGLGMDPSCRVFIRIYIVDLRGWVNTSPKAIQAEVRTFQ